MEVCNEVVFFLYHEDLQEGCCFLNVQFLSLAALFMVDRSLTVQAVGKEIVAVLIVGRSLLPELACLRYLSYWLTGLMFVLSVRNYR